MGERGLNSAFSRGEKFAALTADIIGSRKLKDQGFSRSQIEKAISQLNTARRHLLSLGFCLLRGDEKFRGGLSSSGSHSDGWIFAFLSKTGPD